MLGLSGYPFEVPSEMLGKPSGSNASASY